MCSRLLGALHAAAPDKDCAHIGDSAEGDSPAKADPLMTVGKRSLPIQAMPQVLIPTEKSSHTHTHSEALIPTATKATSRGK